MNKKVALVAVFVVGAIVGIAGARLPLVAAASPARSDAAKPAAAQPPNAPAAPQPAPQLVEDGNAVYKVPVGSSPVRGPADALVTIVEVSDFECPFCKQGAATLKRIEDAYAVDVRVVYKHNPLSMHRNALPAAKLAEEARTHGGDAAFWAAHDRIFELPSLDRPALLTAGKSFGLNAAKLEATLDGHGYEDRIRDDQILVQSLGAHGTPTYFVNGRKVVGAVAYEVFKNYVEDELTKARALVQKGVKPADVYARTIEKGATSPVMVAIAAARPAAAPEAPTARAPQKIAVRADDPVRGPAVAPVTIVLFSDFQCPFCSKVEPVVKELEKAYSRDVRIVWKHLPLSFHPNALPAAKAAEAARAQGKFWELHDRLFAGQQSLSEAFYVQSATELKLDVERFKKDVAGQVAAKRIAEDQAVAAAVGATGTPTLFVNCRKVVGAQPFEAFKAVIDEELAKAKKAKVDAAYYDAACAANLAAAPPPAAPAQPRDVKVTLRPDDPSRGGKDAKVTVVEFSDFQCPFCSRAVPVVKEVEREFGGDVRVVWKHLPLSFHPNAMPAAIAAEAARQQGKFWEMHDRLFEGQQSLSDAAYAKNAKELGLDMARFEKALKDPATRARVEEDARAGAAAGVNGTPTFVVNGEPVTGSAALKDAVRRHLEKARGAKG
jgi:protein-disulfide isomerase